MKALILGELLFQSIARSVDTTVIPDENVCILFHSEKAEQFENANCEWVSVSTQSNPKTFFYRQIISISNDNCTNNPILTHLNLYNLNACSSSTLKPKLDNTLIVHDILDKFLPKHATNARLAMLDSYHKISVTLIDNCLKNYFLKSRYLHEGDLVCIEISQYVPEAIFEDFTVENRIYFKVESVEGPPYLNNKDGFIYGYIINTNYTTVHQVNSTQCYIPTCDFECINSFESIENIGNELHPVIPNGMDSIYEKLEEIILPFLTINSKDIKLSPIFFLSGKSGTGKSTILSALAKKQGIHYWSENCTLIQNSNPAQTESIINNIFSKVTPLSPCILHFRFIEALCEDESGNKDDRTIDCFIKNIKSLESNFPVIIFCTTSQESKLMPALQRIFLQTVQMESLNYESRHSLLSWILKKESIKTDNFDEIVRSTSNFVFSDLIQLVSRALKISCQQFSVEKGLSAGEKIFSLNQYHFAEALDQMNDAYADAIGAPEIPNVTWDDIGGLSHLKEEILSSLLQPVLPNGLRRSGLLLHGPPGTGKTLLAKAVATECKYNFLSVKGPELLNMYVGQSEKNVREVFTRARESAPCIVFFDELDSLAPKRGQSGGSGSVMDRVVSQLLAEMDGIHKSSGIFILAATNRPDLIDSALLRPGRLDKMLYVGSCKDTESKLAVLKALTRKFKFSTDVNLEKLVSLLPMSSEMTGADLYGICSNAWLSAARRHIKNSQTNDGVNLGDDVSVCGEDMITAISQFKVKDLSSD